MTSLELPGHNGIVTACFVTEWKNGIAWETTEEGWRRFLTNVDAAVVYRSMREKHPEHAELPLFVEVVGIELVRRDWRLPSADDVKRVAARGIDTRIWRTPDGEQPVRKLLWLGDWPGMPFMDKGPLEVISPTGDRKLLERMELLASIMTEDRLPWATGGP